MDAHQKVLFVDTATGYYRVSRFPVGDFFGPADLGLYLSGRHNSLNIGVGILAGSIFPGSNRLIVTGFSPCWGGFYISSTGGAGLVFDNLGINMVSLIGRAPSPSLLYLNRTHGEEIDVRLILNLEEGPRKLARRLAREKGKALLDPFVYTAYARKGWMVPNQYWTPGALSPMAIMGKYYMYYGNEFMPPRKLGRINAQHFLTELIVDNLGTCRFHRAWAEEMLPEIVESLYGMKEVFLKRQHEVEGNNDPELLEWIDRFEKNIPEAALTFWYEIHKDIHESLREF